MIAQRLEVITVGETMATLVRDPADGRYILTHAGGESNVAIGLAQLGHRVGWISRLGDDPFGNYILNEIRRAGVAPLVERDSTRNTGLMVKEITAQGTRVRYYRANSAASVLGAPDPQALRGVRWLHMTGVTPALSDSAREAAAAYYAQAKDMGVSISFDVNYRPRLWADAQTAWAVLLEFCRRADLVFVGDDEAKILVGSLDPQDFAAVIGLSGSRQLVFKRGAAGADYLDAAARIFEPARKVEVVDVTGAGDAFAAGYLSGLLRGWDVSRRLRLGHLNASKTVQVVDDVAPAPTPAEIAAIAADDLLP